MNWRCKSLLDAPASADAVAKSTGSDPEFSRPISKDAGLTVKGEPETPPCIFTLIPLWEPCAVGWCIALVIVFTFNGVPRRRDWPHVGEETFKPKPAFTDGDAAALVIVVNRTGFFMFIVGHAATGLHGQPACIFVANMALGRVAVFVVSRCYFLLTDTAAACRATVSEITGGRNDLIAAIALAEPLSFFVAARGLVSRCFLNDREPSELLPREIKHHVATLSSDVKGPGALVPALLVPPILTKAVT